MACDARTVNTHRKCAYVGAAASPLVKSLGVTPADGRRRRSTLDAAPHYRAVRAGDVVPALAHEREPGRVQLVR